MNADGRQGERDPETYAVIGAAMAVHSELGRGFLEAVYQEAMEIELSGRGIPFRGEHPIQLYYRGMKLATPYRVDFLCYENLLVELKALSVMGGVEEAQVINHLKGARLEKALLINFGTTRLSYKRMILSPDS